MISEIDRLNALFTQVNRGTQGLSEIQGELRSLMASASFVQRDNLSASLEWAEIYFSPKRWQRWGSQERVKTCLLQSLYKAAASFDESEPVSSS